MPSESPTLARVTASRVKLPAPELNAEPSDALLIGVLPHAHRMQYSWFIKPEPPQGRQCRALFWVNSRFHKRSNLGENFVCPLPKSRADRRNLSLPGRLVNHVFRLLGLV